jgi:acyl transferase domain-containing protein
MANREQALELLKKIASNEKHPTLIWGKVAHDFMEQPMLLEYAGDLLGKLLLLQDDQGRYQQALAALGDLYCQGYSLNWLALHGKHPPQRLSLPTYPFARERYWVDQMVSENPIDTGIRAVVLHPLRCGVFLKRSCGERQQGIAGGVLFGDGARGGGGVGP